MRSFVLSSVRLYTHHQRNAQRDSSTPKEPSLRLVSPAILPWFCEHGPAVLHRVYQSRVRLTTTIGA